MTAKHRCSLTNSVSSFGVFTSHSNDDEFVITRVGIFGAHLVHDVIVRSVRLPTTIYFVFFFFFFGVCVGLLLIFYS